MTLTHPGEELARRTGRSGWASGRYNGTNLTGSKGSGKSTFDADIAFYDYLWNGGIGQILIDPIGVGLIDTFLWRLWCFLRKVPTSHQSRFLERVKYINVAATDSICPFPLLYKTGKERSLLDVSERYLQTILLTSPWLMQGQVYGWPPLHYIGSMTAVILAALDLPLTIAFDCSETLSSGEAPVDLPRRSSGILLRLVRQPRSFWTNISQQGRQTDGDS